MSIFKDSFTQKVRDHLTARGKAFLQRTSNDIIYINGRAAWVRMVSGVDVTGFGDALAKENILQGGVLQGTGALRSGVGQNYTSNAYSRFTDGPLGTQSNLNGLRPMPGITGLDVASKSAYGSVRVATVTFSCWDIKQLELMELLYMRPGFIALVEWGWLPYLNNKGNIESNVEFYDIFKAKKSPTDDTKPISLQERLIEVYEQSKKADANYEGILGYIKNYEWSARPDGGYDCRTEIISTGEILESLKVNYSTNFVPSSELGKGLITKSITAETQTKGLEDLYKTNIIAGIAGELTFTMYNYINDGGYKWEEGVSYNFKDSEGKITGEKDYPISMFGIGIESGDEKADDVKSNNGIEKDKQVYINLDAFLKILSKWVVPVDKSNDASIVPLSSKSRGYDTDSNAKENLLCLYHPLQISVDPLVCLIKNTKIQYLKNIPIPDNTITSVFDPIQLYPGNKAKQTFSFFIKNWIKTFITGLVSADNMVEYTRLSTNIIIDLASKRGINKTDTTEIISNAWEEYKYFNTPAIAEASAFSVRYRITSPDGDNIYETEYFGPIDAVNEDVRKEVETKKQAKINEISNIDFKQIVSHIIDSQTDTALALGADYSSFYIATPEIASLSKSSILAKIGTVVAEDKRQNLPVDSIKFLENEGLLNYEKDEFGVIGNIYINLNNILELSTDSSLEGNDVKEKREINLYDFLKKLMNQIQGSIGSLNNFDIHVDPVDGIARVIDINYVDAKSRKEAYDNAYTFLSSEPVGTSSPKLNGLFNNIRSYRLNSQIFKEQSSIVAISAQNGGGVMGLDNETLVGFTNNGLTNRLLPSSNPKAAPDYANNQIAKNQLINTINSSLSVLFTFLEDLGWIERKILFDKSRKYQEENTEKYKNILRDFIATYQSLTKTKSSFRAIIPTVLSLELDGIGGLVIGHMFRLPSELLPVGYKSSGFGRKQGYIITKLGHKISNSDWTTQIDAQTIILEDNPANTFDLNVALEAAKNGAKVTINTTGEIKVEFPKETAVSELWTLVAISAAENLISNPQGMADVAQSIYNRLNAGGYGKTIRKIVTAPNQYEPTFKNVVEWGIITSRETAIQALKNSKNINDGTAAVWIDKAYTAIKDSTLRANAASFVGSRTEFLAEAPNSKEAVGVVERTPKNANNAFYWRYEGKTVFYSKNLLAATAIPKNLTALI